MTCSSMPSVIAGIGCRRGTDAADIIAVLRDAEARAGATAIVLAAPEFKSHEAGLHEAAAELDLPLILLSDTLLASVQPFCPTRSIAAERHTGHASIAEASALAAAGPGATLLLDRIAHPTATCALAVAAEPKP